jgi:hypothetical protein
VKKEFSSIYRNEFLELLDTIKPDTHLMHEYWIYGMSSSGAYMGMEEIEKVRLRIKRNWDLWRKSKVIKFSR